MSEVPADEMTRISQAVQQIRSRDKVEVKIAGTGGQGVILAGYLLGLAAMNANFSAVQKQSYGAAARGTTVSSDVIIQRTGVVNFPVVKRADLLVAFTQTNFDALQRKVKPNGLVMVDEDLVERSQSKLPVLRIPGTRLAQTELKSKVVANIVMVGYLITLLGDIPLVAARAALAGAVPERFLTLNQKAFELGRALAEKQLSISGK